MLPGKSYTTRDFIDIARRRWWLLAIPPLVTLLGALVYSSTVPDLYRSDMLIAVVPQRVPDEFVRSTVTLQTQERLSAIQVQIMSRSILEPIITEFNLYPEERQRLPLEDVVLRLRGAIEVQLQSAPASRGSETTAFRVGFTYTDPDIATRVTERLGSIFVDQNARDRGAVAKATDDFLQSQLNEARQRLEEHEKRVETFRQRHGNELPTQLQSNLQAMQNAQLQVQALVEAIARDRDRKLMLERLYQEAANEPQPTAQLVMATPAGEPGGGAPTALSPAQQLAAARLALAGMELRLTPEHPDLVRTKRLVAELEEKAEAEKQAKAAAAADGAPAPPPAATAAEALQRERIRQMKAEIESLDRLTSFKEAEERRLREQITEYQRRIEAVPGIESEWVALTRDYDTQQENYRSLLNKSEASRVALDLESRQISEHFRILDPARRPVTPISPIRYQITAAGFAAGLIFGLGVIALLEIRDSSFRSEMDVLRLLSLPVLAAVPYVETARERARRIRRNVLLSACGVLLASAGGYVFWSMKLWNVVV